MKTLLTTLVAFASLLAVPLPAEVKKEPPAKAAGHVKYEGGDGSSLEKAVIIKGAKGEEEGVNAEYAWLAKKHPGYKMHEQSLLGEKGRKYDVITIEVGGKKFEVFFDITDYFGKL
jgi:hypothetical protein